MQALEGSHQRRQKDVEFEEGSNECDRHCVMKNFARDDCRGAISENREFRQHFGIIVADIGISSVESKRQGEGGRESLKRKDKLGGQ